VVLTKQYRTWLATFGDEAITHGGVFIGTDFHRRFLCVRNSVLNASAMLWSASYLHAFHFKSAS